MTHDPSAPTSELPASPASLEAQLQALEARVLHLQAAVSQAQALFQDSPGPAFLLTPQGRLLDVNARGTALLGSSAPLLLGRSFTLFLASSSQAAFAALLGRVFEGRGPQTGEIQLLTPGGEVLDLTLHAALHQPPGEAPYCQVILMDVTAFKLAHRVLLDTQQVQERQIEAQAVRLRALGEEFEGVMLTSGRALDDTLTRGESYLTLLHQHPQTPGHLGHAEEALRQTRGLLGSLRQYMQLRFLRARLRSVDLGRVLREVLKDVQEEMAGRDVQVTSAPLPTVYGDSQVLQIILHEYVSNALKFTRTRAHTRLRVLVQEDTAEYRIGVEDNGVGFHQRQKDRTFELFGKLHSSSVYEGTGLGLAVVRRLCERFGGRAWGEGKVDQGATFWFAWPKAPTEK
ncbi:PAS domain-containing sensor histidine kinase [Deinococcus aestuarii]|uniref:PAS domain-containing sensor histidine kinase n=1 Tax=Deinococcus aestuarii TaxID=2774531 RepID=UPI001C0D7B0E|nr:ATP-binding protein [Deinococcus aestuarii]